MNRDRKMISRSEDQTRKIGEKLAAFLVEGDVVFLIGELGAGKTHLTKGLALGLGLDSDHEVTSPTFTLINQHEGEKRLYHIDLYRLEYPAELDDLGLEEILGGDGVSVVEWPDRFGDRLGEPTVVVRLSIGETETDREISLEWAGGDEPSGLDELLNG